MNRDHPSRLVDVHPVIALMIVVVGLAGPAVGLGAMSTATRIETTPSWQTAVQWAHPVTWGVLLTLTGVLALGCALLSLVAARVCFIVLAALFYGLSTALGVSLWRDGGIATGVTAFFILGLLCVVASIGCAPHPPSWLLRFIAWVAR